MVFGVSEVLRRVEWGKPVAKLLSQCKELNKAKAASLIIRHSERKSIEKPSEIRLAGLTDVGREASRNFGHLLPKEREIRIHHSPIYRCRETAECILDGAKGAGLNGIIVGELNILEGPRADWDKFSQYLVKDWPDSINYYLSGRYPTFIVEPSLDYSQRVVKDLDAKALEPKTNALTIYVAHDLPILTLLFHWFGVSPSLKNASFLNGFLFQRSRGKISLFFEDVQKEYDLPYWWSESD